MSSNFELTNKGLFLTQKINKMANLYDFGLVGLGVMGRNFILNVVDNGFTAMGLDLNQKSVDSLIEEGGNVNKVDATTEAKEFVARLSRPRKIMSMKKACIS